MGMPGRTRETAPMAGLLVRGGSVLVDGAFEQAELAAEDGVLVDVAAVGSDAHVIDAEGLLVVPGYVDLQCNGGLGIDLAGDPERLWELGAALPRFGVTAWLPTIVTTPDGIVDRAIDALAAGPPPGWRGAAPLGLHLEGPFLSEEKRARTQPRCSARPRSLRSRAGHASAASPSSPSPPTCPAPSRWSRRSWRGGSSSRSGTPPPPTPRRWPRSMPARPGSRTSSTPWRRCTTASQGSPALALADDRLHVGLIPDGIHLHPQVVAMAQRALGHRLTIVTDAVAALGMPPGRQALGRTEVTIDDHGVRLADGTLAGSNLAMDQGVRNLVAFSGCAPQEAIHAASTAPAAVLGDTVRGTLAPGTRADVLLLTDDLELVATVIGGVVVHDARSTT